MQLASTDVVDAGLVVCVSGHWVSCMIWDAARGVINRPKLYDAALNRVSWLGGVGTSLILKFPALVSYKIGTTGSCDGAPNICVFEPVVRPASR